MNIMTASVLSDRQSEDEERTVGLAEAVDRLGYDSGRQLFVSAGRRVQVPEWAVVQVESGSKPSAVGQDVSAVPWTGGVYNKKKLDKRAGEYAKAADQRRLDDANRSEAERFLDGRTTVPIKEAAAQSRPLDGLVGNTRFDGLLPDTLDAEQVERLFVSENAFVSSLRDVAVNRFLDGRRHVTVDELAGRFDQPKRKILEHPYCGLLPETVDAKTVRRMFVNNAGIDMPGQDAPVDVKTLASVLGIPQVAVRDLLLVTGRTATHGFLDEYAALRRADPGEFRRQVDGARCEAPKLREQHARERAEAAEQRRLAAERERAETDRLNSLRDGLDLPLNGRKVMTTTDAAKTLRISTSSVRSALKRGDLKGFQETARGFYGPQDFWRVTVDSVASVAANPEQPRWLSRARKALSPRVAEIARHRAAQEDAAAALLTDQQERSRRSAKDKEAHRAAMEKARAAVRPHLRIRTVSPETVVAHLGPTNSGKTHDALAALAETGSGTYAAPLRMLAAEAYDRLSGLVGDSQVGLVTGEERVNEDAPIVCCTAEMAPSRGELLVLDEVQWADDPDRGWAWTSLLAGAEYNHLRLSGSPDAYPLVAAAFPQVDVRWHDRLCPLEFTGSMQAKQVGEATVVVAFGKKAVLHVAGWFRDRDRNPAVLYGAMPPAVRRDQVAKFVSGDCDVLVATDVIGHGVNLPARTVLFAETTKFDGVSRRELYQWEVAQIAGRAGRYGMETAGSYGALTGMPGFGANVGLLKRCEPNVEVADGVSAHRKVTRGNLGPTLANLMVETAADLPMHLRAWSKEAQALAMETSWVKVADVDDLARRVQIVLRSADLGLDDTWRFARAPLDPGDDGDQYTLTVLAKTVAGGRDTTDLVPTDGVIGQYGLDAAEKAARRAQALRWFTLAFPGVGSVSHGRAVLVEALLSERISELLQAAMKVSRCETCGKPNQPWSRWCDRCYRARRSSRYDWYDDLW